MFSSRVSGDTFAAPLTRLRWIIANRKPGVPLSLHPRLFEGRR
jgi:hypothetical protein